MAGARGVEGSDAAVYPKLAQANLLRMRHQYKEAEDICLSILRQFPHNLSANTLLGDLAVERGDLEQAKEWYELALDIDPDSAAIAEKLSAVTQEKETKQVANTAEQLGLPVEKPKTGLIAAIAIAAILLVGGVAYYLSQNGRVSLASTPQNKINQPLVIPEAKKPESEDPKNKPTLTTKRISPQDEELTRALGKLEKDGVYVTDARFELNDAITITFNASDDQSEKVTGASLASQAFAVVSDKFQKDITEVDLRAYRSSKLYYTATVKRDAYEMTKTEEWQTAHKDDPAALLKALLSNEKYATDPEKEKEKPSTGDTGNAAAGTPAAPPAAAAPAKTGTTNTTSGN
jgi:tetratricopeptide (TPR) repeat protein